MDRQPAPPISCGAYPILALDIPKSLSRSCASSVGAGGLCSPRNRPRATTRPKDGVESIPAGRATTICSRRSLLLVADGGGGGVWWSMPWALRPLGFLGSTIGFIVLGGGLSWANAGAHPDSPRGHRRTGRSGYLARGFWAIFLRPWPGFLAFEKGASALIDRLLMGLAAHVTPFQPDDGGLRLHHPALLIVDAAGPWPDVDHRVIHDPGRHRPGRSHGGR